MNKLFFLAGALGALLVTGCSSGDSQKPDGGSPDAGMPDGGEGGGQPDGGQPEVKHELTTRPLLGTSPQNLLLDPLVTTDGSLEHFISLVVLGGGSYQENQPLRAFQSLSPAGVALPVSDVARPAAIQPGATRLEIVAPMPGSASPLEASVWVSAGDSDKKAVAFSTAASDFVVALLPNDKPTKTYPLAVSGKPVELGGRSWVKFALPAAVSMPEGGWFSMTTTSVKWTYQVQAPEVVTSTGNDAKPAGEPLVVARDPAEATVLSAYTEIARRHPPRPPH